MRHAAALPMPCLISARYWSRCPVSGCAPGDFRDRYCGDIGNS